MDSLHEPADSGTAGSDPAAFDIFALRELPDLLKITPRQVRMAATIYGFSDESTAARNRFGLEIDPGSTTLDDLIADQNLALEGLHCIRVYKGGVFGYPTIDSIVDSLFHARVESAAGKWEHQIPADHKQYPYTLRSPFGGLAIARVSTVYDAIHLAAATLHETFCCAVVGAMVRTWCEHVPISARWLSRYVRTPRRGRSRS